MKITPNITYHSVLSGIKDIKERNKVFNELDPQSQRLEQAWDALNLIISHKLGASFGNYWSRKLMTLLNNYDTSETFQNKLLQLDGINSFDCQVCQRGLLMVSRIRLGNNLLPDSTNVICGTEDNIIGFSIASFEKMENEYEDSYYEHPYSYNSVEKLANICCNILVNGDFNIEDKTDYLTIKY